METRNCQNCKTDFVIEPEDFVFYEKIQVPPPTFCPECRTVRRLQWRNEMSLYRRKCAASGHDETMISIYPPEENLVVYDLKKWWSDDWDPMEYGDVYDFSRPFFSQWKELRNRFPLQTLSNSKATNSDYCNVAEESRDSYMCSATWKIDRTLYVNRASEITDSADLYVVHRSELCYDDVICTDAYHLLYSLNSKSCVDSYFLYDCHGCTNCFGCTNLRNKSYCMWNEQLTKEEYFRRLSQMNLDSYETILALKQKFNRLRFTAIHRFAMQIKAVDSTGDNLEGVKNCKQCFDSSGQIEDCKYSHWLAVRVKDVYDSGPGLGLAEMTYEMFDNGVGGARNFFGSVVYNSVNVEYSLNCYSCSNLFGCVGLRSKNYCILNRQYSKEEYEELVPKIKAHMMEMPYTDSFGRIYAYGEFFPMEFSPFAYNETVAQDYFPLTKEQALERGYRWREHHANDYKVTIQAKDLPDRLADVSDSITSEVVGCLHEGNCQDRCSRAFRITQDELSLYKRLGVPLPRLCFGCRHDARLRLRNPMRLWHRQCMCTAEGHNHNGTCHNEFETSYAPERKEVIYCESCYQKEVL